MKARWAALLGGIIFSICISGCATPGKESFSLGSELEKQKRLEEAVSMYEEALAKEPGNAEYADALKRAKGLLVKRYVEKAKSLLAAQPRNFDSLRGALNESEKALKAMPQSDEAKAMAGQIKAEMEAMTKKAETLYAAAGKAAELKDWAAAVSQLREIKKFYPGYLDLPIKLGLTESNAVSFYVKEADKFTDAEDHASAIKMLALARQILPDNKEIAESLKEAQLRHNPESYALRGEGYARQGDWDRAVIMVRKAMELRPAGEVRARVENLRQNAVSFFLSRALKELQSKHLYSAYLGFAALMDLRPDVGRNAPVADFQEQMLAAMLARAEAYENNGQLGNAFVWYDKVQKYAPMRKGLFQKVQAVKGKIRQRVMKKVAVMDFTPPSNHADAGRIVTDSLLSYLTRNAAGDLKILARDVLGAILKEIELGQAGLYDIESAKRAGKLKGTDIFIFGSVLQYTVEKNVAEGFKTAMAVVGQKKTPNPSYQAWMAAHSRPKPEELAAAPPQFIDEDIRETVKYKVATHTKTASVKVSFRVIDVEEGEVVITKTLPNKKEVKDTYSEGVDFAKIPYKELKLPSDTDLTEQVVDATIAQLGYEVLSRFQNLQVQHSNTAEMLKKKGEYEAAVEKYVDAIHSEEAKNTATHVSENARKEIEQLLKTIAL